MVILIFALIYLLLICVTLPMLFKKAGMAAAWKGYVPVLNIIEWCRLIGRSPLYGFWLLFPIVNIFTITGMAVDLVRSFGRYSFTSAALAVIYAPLEFFLTARSADAKYEGGIVPREKEYRQQLEEAHKKADKVMLAKLERSPFKKGQVREWAEAVFFAVFAASFIRMFLIEAYVIPTSSMEGSLLVGDYLFVSKAHYGIRTPMTVLQLPLLHNRLPFDKGESYLASPSLPYYRLPAIQKVGRNEPVVFNYPEGDSVFVTPERAYSWHAYKKSQPDADPNSVIEKYTKEPIPLVTRPIDKKDHYIKRCVAIAGDTFEIRNRQIFINGQPSPNSQFTQFRYKLTNYNVDQLSTLGVHIDDIQDPDGVQDYKNGYFNLNNTQVEALKKSGVTVDANTSPNNIGANLFPFDSLFFKTWTLDNYGPMYVPKKGATINIVPENLSLYKTIITSYEHNTLEVKNGAIYINGKETTKYTFQQDYFWMMGDNRHNSEDSRFWGFVPEDHIVGKPMFIWFSTKNASISNGINWSRIFTSANKM